MLGAEQELLPAFADAPARFGDRDFQFLGFPLQRTFYAVCRRC
jgi:hypothetical protein